VVRYPVFDTELAEPTIGEVHLNLGVNPPLRTDSKYSQLTASGSSAPDQWKAGPYTNNKGANSLWTQLRSSKLSIYRTMIRWDHLIQIKRIKELPLTVLPPTHHAPLQPMTP